MSNHERGAAADRWRDAHARSGLRRMRALVAGGMLLLGLGGVLAACGGDDDGEASETITGQTDELGAETSGPASVPETTDAPTTTRAASTTRPSTTRPAVTSTTARATTTSAAPDAEPSPATSAADATDGTRPATETTSGAATDGAGTVTETSAPATSEPGSTVPQATGPTTTAGECEFVENDEFPIQRCDVGPAVRVLQSVLQTLEYEIGTVDCFFGDQTLEAVRAFQEDQELEVTGVVEEETWAAIAEYFLGGWGTDTNDNDLIEPNEITLECA